MAPRPVDVTVRGKDETKAAFDAAQRRMALLEIEAHKMDAAMQQAAKGSGMFAGSLGLIKGLMAGVGALLVGGFFRTAVREFQEGQQSANEMAGAVENLGLSYTKLQPSIDATIAKFQQLSGQDADDVSRAYSNLITKTGSYEKATENLGLVFDIAAKNHLPLIEASDLMAKVLDGNFKPLKALGVQATTVGEAIEKLGAKYRGFAERESGTMKVALGNVAEAYRNVAQQVGEAILGNTEAGGAVSGLASALGNLAHWLEANRGPLSELTSGVVTFTEKVGDLAGALGAPIFRAFGHLFAEGYKDAQAVIVGVVATFEILPYQAKYMAGGVLKAFGELADGLEGVLGKLGIKLDGFGEKLANTGSKMQRTALAGAGVIGRASRDTINSILAGTSTPATTKTTPSGTGTGTDTPAALVSSAIARAEALSKAFANGISLTDAERREVLLGKTLDDLERMAHDLSLKLEDREKAAAALKSARDANPFLAKSAKGQFGTELAGPAANDPNAPMSLAGPIANLVPPAIIDPAISFTGDLADGFDHATASIFGTVDAIHTLGGDIGDVAATSIANFAGAWGEAVEEIKRGSFSVGDAISQAARKAVGAAASAKGDETLLDAGKAFALGLGGDYKQFAAAAKLFAVGTGYKALAGALGGGGGGRGAAGGGGGSGLSADGFQSSAKATENLGKVTVVLKGSRFVLDKDDPQTQDDFVALVKKVAGNRQVEFISEGA